MPPPLLGGWTAYTFNRMSEGQNVCSVTPTLTSTIELAHLCILTFRISRSMSDLMSKVYLVSSLNLLGHPCPMGTLLVS